MKLKNSKIAKNLLYVSLFLLPGCSVNYALRPVSPDIKFPSIKFTLKENEKVKKNLESISGEAVYDYWKNSQTYPKYTSLFSDSDKDGVINMYDPWPYSWGPYQGEQVDYQNLELSLSNKPKRYSPLLEKRTVYSLFREEENSRVKYKF